MRLSTKGRIAVTAMMELALSQDQTPVPLADISATQHVSISYLEQLFARLRNQGLVKGMRGPGGGYYLAKPVAEITVAEIVTAVDERAYVAPTPGVSYNVPHKSQVFKQMWGNLSKRLYDFLNSITLQEIVDEAKAIESNAEAEPGVANSLGIDNPGPGQQAA